jgi:hypothetical protein
VNEPIYKILFYGQCKQGFAQVNVQQNLAIFLRKPASTLDKVFSGKTVVVKRSDHSNEILRYAEHLDAIGMVVHIDPPVQNAPVTTAAAPAITDLPPVSEPAVSELPLNEQTVTDAPATIHVVEQAPVVEAVPVVEPVSVVESSSTSVDISAEQPLILDLSLPTDPTQAKTAPIAEAVIIAPVAATPNTPPKVATAPKPVKAKASIDWKALLKKLFSSAKAKPGKSTDKPAKPTAIKPISTPTPSNATTAVVTTTPVPASAPETPAKSTAPAKAAAPTKPTKRKPSASLQQRIKYRIDTFMAKGGTSTFKALLVVFLITFVVMAILRSLLQNLHPELPQQEGELDFLNNIYMTFLQLTDPGNMAQDLLSSGWYKLLAIMGGFAGIILFSALIAFITTELDQKISALKRGRSKVIEKNQTLILGWNEQRIVEIIRELVIAHESEADACIVILADHDKELMDDMLRLRLPELGTTRIVTRNGRVSTLANLDMVSIEHCHSIIILANCDDTDLANKKMMSDACVIQTILAVTGKMPKKDDICVVAEIFNPAYRDIITHSFADTIVTINTSDILAKLLVQTSRSVGLSTVYNEILSFDGCEMYFHHADWKGARFGELAFHFMDGVPMGVRQADGILLLNPSNHYIMQTDDHILILADDDSTVKYQSIACAHGMYFQLPDRKLNKSIERELIIGWNHKARIILQEFADYVTIGSQINILLADPTDEEREEIQALNDTIRGVDIQLLQFNSLNRDHLLEIQPFSYNNIIILASVSDGHDAQQIDSENIVTLLLLRSIFNEYPEDSAATKLITEVLDSQNLPLVARAGVKDVIISSRLVSMIMAQVSQSKDMKRVYDDLFSEDGSEIYIKPASLYFDHLPITLNFADLIALAQQRNEICLGIKIKALEFDASKNNGIQLIPTKMQSLTLGPEDSLVVLAEDEF